MKKALLLLIAVFTLFTSINLQAQLVFDLEFSSFASPSGYQADEGVFSDALYIMNPGEVHFDLLLNNNGTLVVCKSDVGRIKIFAEDENGDFSILLAEKYFGASLPPETDSVEINIDPGELDFQPMSYNDYNAQGSDYIIPDMFKYMANNVTPRYKAVVELEADEDTTNNSGEIVFRLYLKKGIALLSAENTWQDIDLNSDRDIIAGRLNFDSLHTVCTNLENQLQQPGKLFDYFDRNSWEPQSADYTQYNTLFWVDGDDKAIAETERQNIIKYAMNGNYNNKSSIAIFSQEAARYHGSSGTDYDNTFLNKVLAVENVEPGNPLGKDISNNGNKLIETHGYIQTPVKITTFQNDPKPYCGLLSVQQNVEGLCTYLMMYENSIGNDSCGAVLHNTLYYNVIYVAVDFRHIGNTESILLLVLDNIAKNSGEDNISLSIDNSQREYFPGETADFRFRAQTFQGPAMGVSINCHDTLSGVEYSVITDNYGYGTFNFTVDENAEPGRYLVKFSYKTSIFTTNVVTGTYKVLDTKISYTGPEEVCEGATDSYQAVDERRDIHWTALENCSIVGYTTQDVVEVKWENEGEARIELRQFIPSISKTSRDTIVVNVLPQPEKPTITRAETILALISSSPVNNYWYEGDEYIENDHNDTLIVYGGGDYSVKVLGENGCFSEADTLRLIISVEEEILSDNQLNIYPNPSGGKFDIDISGINDDIMEIQITDINGTVILRLDNIQSFTGNSVKIDLDNISNGLYYCILKTRDGVKTDPIVILK